MQQETSKTSNQVVLSVSPPRHGRALAGIALLLTLGQGGFATAAPPPATCAKQIATIVGTNRAETIVGTAGADVIQARYGDDKIYGLEGNDLICSSSGKDTVYGGYGDIPVSPPPPSGNDRLLGGEDNDTLAGEDGNDFIDGSCPCPANTGRDRCDGGSGTGDVAQNCEIKTGFP